MASHPANGTLFPQPWIETPAGPRRLDELAGTGWRIVWDGRHAEPAAWPDATSVAIGGPGLGALHERDGVLAGWFDRHGCVAAIVRPDHYVYGVLIQPEQAAAALAQLNSRLAA
jgi:3-(3-hydroxy-phenyl)propionate hydroxylase